MSIVLANGKKAKLLEQERSYLNGLVYCLYTVDYVPVAGMTLTNFQPLPTDTGAKVQKPPAFTPATLNGANQGELVGPALVWTMAYDQGPFTIYGYLVLDTSDQTVVFAERAPAPFAVTGAGQTYSVTPRKQMDTM